MHRRLSSFVKNPRQSVVIEPSISEEHKDNGDAGDAQSQTSDTMAPDVPLAPPTLKVKRVDYYYSRWSKEWKYRNMSSKVVMEKRPFNLQVGNTDAWKDFCFVIVRTMPKNEDLNQEPTFKIVVKSDYIVTACKAVIRSWPGISWTAEPLELEPEMFLTFLPSFAAYRDELMAKKYASDEDKHVVASVDILIKFLHTDYRDTIATINNLKAHGEITFEHLYSILVPRSILVATCAVTGEPRAFQLISYIRTSVDGKYVYQLTCESIDQVDRPTSNSVTVSRVLTYLHLPFFKGTVKIASLDAYPIQYHPSETELRETLIARGRKWLSLTGIHHMQYKGLGAIKGQCGLVRHSVNGRVMIDRATFRRLNPNYPFPMATMLLAPAAPPINRRHRRDTYDSLPVPVPLPPVALPGMIAPTPAVMARSKETELTLSDEDLFLTSAVLYGFSLSDKIWLEFNVEKMQNVEWNADAFANLVLPQDRKTLLQSLVEAHHQELGFDDFIKGKGHGLVINLFGPPGVGKTFSAEATSEHVKRPLYVVGAGDLGTRANELDAALERVFDVATAWKAIVLIDEADVFLEQRSLHDLDRNATVAVFLRHVEYYRGILFLTTNRVKAFDEAFLSRIHVALHFRELTDASKAQVGAAFIAKVHADITPAQIAELAKKDVNGRQIKNAVRTAHSLAVGRKEKVAFSHFMETLAAMEEFTKEFEAIRSAT